MITTEAIDLLSAVEHMVDTLSQLDTDGTWESMTCMELESIADVMTLAGNSEAAEMIRKIHAQGDDDGDMHGEGYSENENKEDGK